MEWTVLQRKDTAAVNKYMACDARPQATALPDDHSVQETDNDRIGYLQQYTDGIGGIGKVYDMTNTEGYGRNDDGNPQVIF